MNIYTAHMHKKSLPNIHEQQATNRKKIDKQHAYKLQILLHEQHSPRSIWKRKLLPLPPKGII